MWVKNIRLLDAPHAMLWSSTMQQSFRAPKPKAVAIFSAILRVDRLVPDFLAPQVQIAIKTATCFQSQQNLLLCVCVSFHPKPWRPEVSFQLPTLQGLPRQRQWSIKFNQRLKCPLPLPSGKLTVCYGKSPFWIGKSPITGVFSIAMLNYWRVCGIHWIYPVTQAMRKRNLLKAR